jgi:hypothetical protein
MKKRMTRALAHSTREIDIIGSEALRNMEQKKEKIQKIDRKRGL